MSVCKKYETCIFLGKNRKDMPALTEILARRLCQGNYVECAIHYVHNYLENQGYSDNKCIEDKLNDIVESLMPNDMAKAKKLLERCAQ